MIEIVGKRFYEFNTPGSMGLVNDTRYLRCFWPALSEPTALFEDGSSGIEVEGPPTPRNVVFPKDTVFAKGTRADCFFVGKVVASNFVVAEVTQKDCDDFIDGKKVREDLEQGKMFVTVREAKASDHDFATAIEKAQK